MSQTHNKIRLDYLDWFRVLACVAVVTIHVTASAIGAYQAKSLPQILVTILNGWMLFAVPAFIAISGYTFMAVYEGKDLSFKTFFKKRVTAILIPYIAWNLFYNFYVLRIGNQPFVLNTLLYNLATGKAFYHLYFMPLIFQFYLLFIPLKKLVDRISWPWILIGTFVFHYFYTKGLKPHILLSDRVFMSYLVFYMCGMLLGKYHLSVIKNIKYWIFPAFIGYGISEFFYITDRVNYFALAQNSKFQMPYAWEFSSLFSILMLIALSQALTHWSFGSNLVKRLSPVTFDIYLAHPLILSLLALNFAKVGIGSTTVQTIVSWALGLLIPAIGAIFIKTLYKKRVSRH